MTYYDKNTFLLDYKCVIGITVLKAVDIITLTILIIILF